MTIVMPQMGTEYALEPTAEQKELYHNMIDWGADVVLGGHPHVIEPSETILKGKDKNLLFILWEFYFQPALRNSR